jgi:hypothetical protein
MAEHVDQSLHRKSGRGSKKPPPKKSRYKNGGQVSTHKRLRAKIPDNLEAVLLRTSPKIDVSTTWHKTNSATKRASPCGRVVFGLI